MFNKTITIESAHRGDAPKLMFNRVAQTIAYVWNASTIDGTDIPRSVAAVGRVFPFPFDLATSPLPEPVFGNLSTVHAYLRMGQANAAFSTSILQILTQDRRDYHRSEANTDVSQRLFEVGDYVMARSPSKAKLLPVVSPSSATNNAAPT